MTLKQYELKLLAAQAGLNMAKQCLLNVHDLAQQMMKSQDEAERNIGERVDEACRPSCEQFYYVLKLEQEAKQALTK